jgi:hypothetical protein
MPGSRTVAARIQDPFSHGKQEGHDAATARLSVEPRDRTALRRLVWQIYHLIIGETVTPSFRRIVTFDDRMTGCVKMRARVAMR